MISLIERLVCLFGGHRDVRIIAEDFITGITMYRCASCNKWWSE